MKRTLTVMLGMAITLPHWLATTVPARGAQSQEVASTPDYRSWYPRTTRGDKGSVVVYAPQVESWSGFKTLTAWVAFNATRASDGKSYYGSLRFDARTDTDLEQREVLLHDIHVLELSIKGVDDASPEHELAEAAFSAVSRKVPLDLVLEYLPQAMVLPESEGLSTVPPRIFYSTEPAILLAVDSAPVFLPVADTDLEFVLNTNWDVLRHAATGPLYLCYQQGWLTADQLEGPWRTASLPPPGIGALPPDANWDNVRSCSGGERAKPGPTVFYATEPAELLLLEGRPRWEPIAQTGLDYAPNTRQELYRADDRVYLLLSGRWFAADSPEGPWTYAGQLPDAFQGIPVEGHAKSYIRKNVPGTREAWEAALVASVPRRAEIRRGADADLALEVSYAGEPMFQTIEGTDVRLALNTSHQVLEYQGSYYVCHNATWLKSDAATGPWTFAEEIPADFSRIPPSSPAYNTTFVQVEDSDAEVIEYSYSAGYQNAYVSNQTVVYGTGFAVSAASVWLVYEAFDDDYWYGYPGYPYYPWPPTYGYGSWYDPDTGRYGETLVGYGPYGAAAGTAVFNPETGIYARGQAVWDSDEYAGRGYAYNPNTDTSIARNRYVDFEDEEGWSNRVARRGDEWRYTESEWEDGEMRTEFESSRGTEGEVVRKRDGDTLESSGTIRYGDREASFETDRSRDGDQITGSGTLSGENRSVDFSSEFEDGRGNVAFGGSEGGSGTVQRELDDGELSGSGSFSRNGNTIETDTTRTAEGVKREFQTSGGGQGTSLRRGDDNAFAFQSGSGDVYAGRDGEVYRKTDDGWTAIENQRGTSNSSFASADRQRQDRSAAIGTSARRDFSQLNRDYQSRQRGYERYSRHQSYGGLSRGAGVGRRRR